MFTQLNHIHRDDDPIAVHAEENLKRAAHFQETIYGL